MKKKSGQKKPNSRHFTKETQIKGGGGEGKSSPWEALQAAAVEQLTLERKYLVWKNSNDNDDLRNLIRVETKSLS